jgi:hypothetical protein
MKPRALLPLFTITVLLLSLLTVVTPHSDTTSIKIEHQILTSKSSPAGPSEAIDKIPSPITSPYTIHNLSANTGDVDLFPDSNLVDGNQLAWQCFDGNDDEIFWYNGTDTIQLTDNLYDDKMPWIHNGQVVWVGNDSLDDEIYFFNGTHTIQLTDNSVNDYWPQIHNGQVVWISFEADWEIYFYNGTNTIHLATGDSPQIHNGQIVWRGDDGSDEEIYLCPNPSAPSPTIINVSSNTFYDVLPSFHDGKVAWMGQSGSDYEIFFYDGSTTTVITSNSYDDHSPILHDGEIVWYGYVDGLDSEVFHYNGTDVIQFTDNDYADRDPYIHEGQVVWISTDGDYEIHLFDGTATIQLTNNSYDDWSPRIHDGWVGWMGYDGQDYEIFLVVTEDIWVPVINHPFDQSYALGTTDHSITWHPSDWNPAGFNITRDDTLVTQDAWTGGSLTTDIDGLTVGLHNYTCTVWDLAGASTSDAVLVYVYEITIPIPVVPLAFMIGALIGGVVIGLVIGLLVSLIYRRARKT